jgi:hypothetical protein
MRCYDCLGGFSFFLLILSLEKYMDVLFLVYMVFIFLGFGYCDVHTFM